MLFRSAANLRAGAVTNTTAPAISVSAPRVGVSQDSAIAIAFLLTELIELSISLDPSAPLMIGVDGSNQPGKARLSLTSDALRATPVMTERLAGRYARVIEGLSRQLRAPIAHDETTGRFAIDFAIVTPPENI